MDWKEMRLLAALTDGDVCRWIFSAGKAGCAGFDVAANFSAHKHVRSEKDIYAVEALPIILL